MRNSPMSLMKVALVRDERFPVGTPSPLYLRCHCGARPKIEGDYVICYGCGTRYDRRGWIQDDDAFGGLDAYEKSVAPVDHD